MQHTQRGRTRMCAIFGIIGTDPEVSLYALHAMQHRAHDFAGMVSSDGENPYREVGVGLASEVFTEKRLKRLHGRASLGHLRYPTVPDEDEEEGRENIQPLIGWSGGQWFALAHNGNLTNVSELKMLTGAARLATSMDSELV